MIKQYCNDKDKRLGKYKSWILMIRWMKIKLNII